MKKSIFTLALIFIVLAIFSTSCDPDDPTINDIFDENGNVIENNDGENTDQLGGSYKIYINETVVAEGTTEEVGLVQDNLGAYYTNVSLSNGTVFSVLVTGFPRKAGEIAEIDGSDIMVTLSGYNLLTTDDKEEWYFSEEGTIKRDSKEKISFEGTCKEMLGTEIMPFSGYVESEAFKVIL